MYPRSASKVGEMLSAGLGEVVDEEYERLVARKSIIEKFKLEEHKRQLIEMEWEEEPRGMLRQEKTIAEEAEQKRVQLNLGHGKIKESSSYNLKERKHCLMRKLRSVVEMKKLAFRS